MTRIINSFLDPQEASKNFSSERSERGCPSEARWLVGRGFGVWGERSEPWVGVLWWFCGGFWGVGWVGVWLGWGLGFGLWVFVGV